MKKYISSLVAVAVVLLSVGCEDEKQEPMSDVIPSASASADIMETLPTELYTEEYDVEISAADGWTVDSACGTAVVTAEATAEPTEETQSTVDAAVTREDTSEAADAAAATTATTTAATTVTTTTAATTAATTVTTVIVTHPKPPTGTAVYIDPSQTLGYNGSEYFE